jgi:hypothetical protein
MPATVLERHYKDRVQSVRQIALPGEGGPALTVREFKDAVALCFELSHSGQQLLELEFKRIFSEPDLTVAWLQERRQAIEELSDNVLDLVTSLKNKACQTWQALGSPSEHDSVSRLDEAIQIIVEARERTLKRWPVLSPPEIARLRTSHSEADFLGAHEAFAQVAGVDVETWRKRLEKRKGLGQD